MSPELAAATAHGPAVPSLSRARRSAFYVALTAALLLLAVPMAPFLVIPLAWPFLAEQLGVHHVHDIGVAALLWLMVVGLLAQARRPERQIGAMQQFLIVALAMVGLTAMSRPATLLTPMLLPFGLAFVGAALHPARAEIARVRLSLDPTLVGLALLAAGPLVVYARAQVRLDHSLLPVASHGGHWTAMATLAVSIALLALLGATRPRGWRVPVWSTGAAAVLFGISAAALPNLPSSVGPLWGSLAAVWGIAFVITAEVRRDRR